MLDSALTTTSLQGPWAAESNSDMEGEPCRGLSLRVASVEVLLLAGVQGRVHARVVDAPNRSEVDSLDVVQALDGLDSLLQLVFRQPVTKVQDNGAS